MTRSLKTLRAHRPCLDAGSIRTQQPAGQPGGACDWRAQVGSRGPGGRGRDGADTGGQERSLKGKAVQRGVGRLAERRGWSPKRSKKGTNACRM